MLAWIIQFVLLCQLFRVELHRLCRERRDALQDGRRRVLVGLDCADQAGINLKRADSKLFLCVSGCLSRSFCVSSPGWRSVIWPQTLSARTLPVSGPPSRLKAVGGKEAPLEAAGTIPVRTEPDRMVVVKSFHESLDLMKVWWSCS